MRSAVGRRQKERRLIKPRVGGSRKRATEPAHETKRTGRTSGRGSKEAGAKRKQREAKGGVRVGVPAGMFLAKRALARPQRGSPDATRKSHRNCLTSTGM
jgi:hypothetical protein